MPRATVARGRTGRIVGGPRAAAASLFLEPGDGPGHGTAAARGYAPEPTPTPMHLGTLLIAATAAVPSVASAQAGSPALVEVFSTSSLAGCSTASPSRPDDVAPCVSGTAVFGRIAPTRLGVRFEISTDWSSYRGPLALTSARLALESRFDYSTAGVSAAECFSVAGRLVGDRCTQFSDFGTAVIGQNLLPGQTATFLREFGLSGPDRVAGLPNTFRLELVDLILEYRDGQGSGTRRVRPVIAASTVPKPATLSLAAAGGGALAVAVVRRRRRRVW